MKFACEQCHAKYRIDEKYRPMKRKVTAKCLKCGNVICIDFTSKPSDDHEKWPRLLPENLLYGDQQLSQHLDLSEQVVLLWHRQTPFPSRDPGLWTRAAMI